MRRELRIFAGIFFEAALGVLAFVLAWSFAVPMEHRLLITPAVVGRSLIALVPMLALLVVATRSTWGPIARLREDVGKLARELFGGARWWELLLVSAAAGAGEELLFRGALQPLAERWFGAALGLIAVSVAFGGLHAASATYFLLATVVGLYLGWLAQRYDDLVAPIFVHAAYDWAALTVLMAASPAPETGENRGHAGEPPDGVP